MLSSVLAIMSISNKIVILSDASGFLLETTSPLLGIVPFDNIHDARKIGDRISTIEQPVTIGDGSFIGFGVHISPGVTIGKNCVIGAGSVVTKPIPDYSVVAGVPAKVIKHYSFEENKWVRD